MSFGAPGWQHIGLGNGAQIVLLEVDYLRHICCVEC